MKYKGKKVKGKNSVVLVLERSEDKIVFIAEAIDSSDDKFDKLVKLPDPPEILRPGGVRESNENDPEYKKAMIDYAELKTAYLIIMSLKDSPDIEWETVEYDKPDTWKNWEKELKESGFNEIERMRVLQIVMRANSLDDNLLEQARQDFLQGRSQQEG